MSSGRIDKDGMHFNDDQDTPQEPIYALETVPTDRLIHELRSRYHALVFTGIAIGRDDGKLELQWKGYGSHALGLAEYAKMRLAKLMSEAIGEFSGEVRGTDNESGPTP